MAEGIRVKVMFKNSEPKYHTLPFGVRYIDIYAWLNDTYGYYGWEDYDII